MKKAREFWIIDESPYRTWVSSEPLYSADTKEEIHVREVLPLDWEKIWEEFDKQSFSPRPSVKKLLQELVEKSIRGEL